MTCPKMPKLELLSHSAFAVNVRISLTQQLSTYDFLLDVFIQKNYITTGTYDLK